MEAGRAQLQQLPAHLLAVVQPNLLYRRLVVLRACARGAARWRRFFFSAWANACNAGLSACAGVCDAWASVACSTRVLCLPDSFK
jgi:hypothetical protein